MPTDEQPRALRIPTCPRTSIAAAAVLLVAALARPAGAATIEDLVTGLRLDLAPPGVDVCVIVPRAARDAAGCAGLDMAGLDAKVGGGTNGASAIALLRQKGQTVLFTVSAPTLAPPKTSEQLEAYLDGVRNAATAARASPPTRETSPILEHHLDNVNGIDVLQYEVDFGVPPDHPSYSASRALVYLFASRRGMAIVTFATAPPDAASLRPIGDAVARTASMPDAGIEGFGESRYHLLGRLIGKLVGMVGMVVAVVVMLIKSRRSRNKIRQTMRNQVGRR